MQRQLVDFKNVTIQIDSQKYFNDVYMSIKKGEFVFLIGKTGSGKSSLLKSIYGEKKIIEGLEDKQLDRISKKIQKKIDALDGLSETFGDEDDDLDQIEDLPEYKDMIEIYKEMLIRDIRKNLKRAKKIVLNYYRF